MNHTSAYFDAIASVYAERDADSLGLFCKQTDLSLIEKVLPETTVNLLDLGCGLGPYSTALSRRFSDIWLVDVSPEMLRIARSRIRSASPTTNVHSVNVDINSLASPQVPNACLILATGASLCYQADTLRAGIRLAYEKLRTGGILVGDVWNKYGMVVCDSYTEEFPSLSPDALLSNPQTLADFLDRGMASEHIQGNSHRIYATDYWELERILSENHFADIHVVGRKAALLIWPKSSWLGLISQDIRLAMRIENLLSEIHCLMTVSPKLTYYARRE